MSLNIHKCVSKILHQTGDCEGDDYHLTGIFQKWVCLHSHSTVWGENNPLHRYSWNSDFTDLANTRSFNQMQHMKRPQRHGRWGTNVSWSKTAERHLCCGCFWKDSMFESWWSACGGWGSGPANGFLVITFKPAAQHQKVIYQFQ